MEIKADLCTGCGQCIIICPVQAIKLVDNRTIIEKNLCVECGVCYRDAECNVKAIRYSRLKWPRIIRSPFSNVITPHKITGIPGRGTEEMKTNDVTNRYDFGELGVSIEIGRPGIGTQLRNIELFTKELVKLDVKFEPKNPITELLINDSGYIRDDIKNEKVLSTNIEFKISENKVSEVLRIIKEIDKKIDTVFSVGMISRVGENGEIPIIDSINQEGFNIRPNAKINIGLGKP
ncbi:MAG: indolepyruvate ferredoxin oxidoreductase subunit alpha [Candidatus Hermodarchaeota archaeon]